MQIYSILQLLLLFIAIILNMILGLFIYQNNRKSFTNLLFFLLSGVMSFWLLFNFLSVYPKYIENSLLLIRFSIFLAAPMSVLFFLLAHTIPNEKMTLNKAWVSLLAMATFIAMAAAVSPYAFIGITIVNNSPKPVPGPGLIPFAILSTLCSISAVYVLIKKIRISVGEAREQLRFMMYGILIMLGLIILTIFLPTVVFGVNIFVPFLPIYTLVFLGMTAYAIVKHHLFNIKVIATEALTTIISIILLTKIFTDESAPAIAVDLFVLLAAALFGILLIKSVRKEVHQREQLEILDKELADANEKLKALDKARAEFITIASHQLRTPPATIKWYLSSLISGDYGKIAGEQKEIIEKTNRTNNSLISLIDDMLNVSRIERGKMEFMFQPSDLLDLAKITVEQLEPIAQTKGLKLTFTPQKKKLPQLVCDKEKVRQVMNNLIDNSIKYTKQGSVNVQLTSTQDEIRFSVTDTGKGMSPEEKGEIFEKFKRGKESSKQSAGLGLGLYVAKVIIEQHKGKIWAESEGDGKGSSFIFTLPINNGLSETSVVDLTKTQG